MVEVDERKFGKRKYNKRTMIEGQWVVGGICRETKDVFLAICPDIIERHATPTSSQPL